METWDFQLCLKSCNLASWTTKWQNFPTRDQPPICPPTHPPLGQNWTVTVWGVYRNYFFWSDMCLKVVYVWIVFGRCLEGVLTVSWMCFYGGLKVCWKCLKSVLNVSWRGFEEVWMLSERFLKVVWNVFWNVSWQCLESVWKASSWYMWSQNRSSDQVKSGQVNSGQLGQVKSGQFN